jgi:hypothetical protein
VWQSLLCAAAVALGCSDVHEGIDAVDQLRRYFPQHASHVLSPPGADTIVATAKGFALRPPDTNPVHAAQIMLTRRGGLRAEFPARGDGVVRLSLPDGFSVEVRELGQRGLGRAAGRGLVYEHAGGKGASFWHAGPAGYEEWLVVRPGPAVFVAAWEVGGATLRKQGQAVELVDASGRARLRVTAPVAYGSGGAAVTAGLGVEGARIVLTVAEHGAQEMLLVDPVWQVAGTLATPRLAHTATLLPSGKVLLAGGLAATYLASAELYDPAEGTFTPTGSLTTARYGHTATLLPSGKVLVAGGYAGLTSASAELYDPTLGTFSDTGTMAVARNGHTATLLPSGKVLVAGGSNFSEPTAAELYHPDLGMFLPTGSLTTGRAGHTATLLSSGKVLLAGGLNGENYLVSAELYDPTVGTFAPTGSLTIARDNHTATLLTSGNVLVAGGFNSYGLASAELYDPSTGGFAPTGTLTAKRYAHTATLLPCGKVLISGGASDSGARSSAELYDPTLGTFGLTAPLATARFTFTATLLPSGKVLVVGGGGLASATAELYDPMADTFSSTTGPLATPRSGHTATLLPSGKVLVAGGRDSSTDCLTSAELYDPTTGTFAATAGQLTAPRYAHTATLLSSGQVLLAGGWDGSSSSASAERYDPVTDTFSPTTEAMTTARDGHRATLLATGQVLIVAGMGNVSPYPALSAELYEPASDTFAPTAGSLSTGRGGFTATLLISGKVLIAGGETTGTQFLDSAELYDPTTTTFTATAGTMTVARCVHTATLLPSGKVLLVGGFNSFPVLPLASTELYDPATEAFAATTGTLATARWMHEATLLTSGKVLVAGGQTAGGVNVASAELHDPATGLFTPSVAPLATARWNHTATMLLSGQVLIAAGHDSGDLASAETFDDGRGGRPSWTPTLLGPLPAIAPGATLLLHGTLFTGISEASSGGTASSATNYPLVLLRRQDNEATTYAPVTSWSASSATARVPHTVAYGPYVVWVVVNGVVSNGQPLIVTPANGATCERSADCASGFCVDATCCADACSTPCMTCANRLGTCTFFVAAGETDPGASPPCVVPSACDGLGNCATPQVDAGVDSLQDAAAPADALPERAVLDDSGQGADRGLSDAGRDSTQGQPGIPIATCGGCAAGGDPRAHGRLAFLVVVALCTLIRGRRRRGRRNA